jgi:UDP-N-acetyl-D-mannosaminuronate dehydrogenase
MTSDRRVAVVGLGYVGSPLAVSFVEAGLEVEGIDCTGLYDTAGLVVDTVDSAAAHHLAARQVLRLGAGWSGTAATPEHPARR